MIIINNNSSINGKCIVITDNKVFVDGKEQTIPSEEKQINITSGREMFKIINTFHKSNLQRDTKFQWGEIENDLLHRNSDYKKLSMRSINHIKDISETIALIELIRNSGNNYNKKLNSLVKIEKNHIIEAFTYKENLLF